MSARTELLEKVETLQNMYIAYATGGQVDYEEFKPVREELLHEPLIKDKLPRFVRTHKDFKQFWGFIKQKSPHYQGRREFLWEEFRPVLDALEEPGYTPRTYGVVRRSQAEILREVVITGLRRPGMSVAQHFRPDLVQFGHMARIAHPGQKAIS